MGGGLLALCCHPYERFSHRGTMILFLRHLRFLSRWEGKPRCGGFPCTKSKASGLLSPSREKIFCGER